MPELPKMPEHKKTEIDCSHCPKRRKEDCDTKLCKISCAPDCPACLYIKLAKYLVGQAHGREINSKTLATIWARQRIKDIQPNRRCAAIYGRFYSRRGLGRN